MSNSEDSSASAETTRDTLLDQVSGWLDSGLEAGFQIPQDTGLLRLDQRALSDVLRLLDGTVETLGNVADACEHELQVDVADVTLPPQQLSDLAFVGRSELVELRKGLQAAIERDSKWQIAALADRAAGRSVRALLPVESALREYQGLGTKVRAWFDLDDTLAIRRRFVRFWLEVKQRDVGRAEELQPALQCVASLIADLRQDGIYPYVRLDDRLDLRALQKRILLWLEAAENGADDAAAEKAGRRLWQDASGFFNLLMQIQRREELREHDLLQLGRVLRSLHDGDGNGARETLDGAEFAEIRESLLDLASREADLDAILLAESVPPVTRIVSAVRRLHTTLLQR